MSTDQNRAWRYAIYFTPSLDSALGKFGMTWMGRHPSTGEAMVRPPLTGFDEADLSRVIERPARYGLHATLKAPFYMAEGRSRDGLVAHLENFAESRKPFSLPALQPGSSGAFVLLRPKKRVGAMDSLAADCVRTFEAYRAPLTEADQERRLLASALSQRQKSLLEEFGYPFVLDQFDFHMTLAGPLEPGERDAIVKVLAKQYKALWKEAVLVDSVSLCEQHFGDPFRIVKRCQFRG